MIAWYYSRATESTPKCPFQPTLCLRLTQFLSKFRIRPCETRFFQKFWPFPCCRPSLSLLLLVEGSKTRNSPIIPHHVCNFFFDLTLVVKKQNNFMYGLETLSQYSDKLGNRYLSINLALSLDFYPNPTWTYVIRPNFYPVFEGCILLKNPKVYPNRPEGFDEKI